LRTKKNLFWNFCQNFTSNNKYLQLKNKKD
jgi:hypothetical protein